MHCAGFGWSPKALVEYDGYKVWARQLGSFIKEVILPESGCAPPATYDRGL